MRLGVGKPFPDFEARTTVGDIQFYDWLGKSWCLLFSVSKNRSNMCTSELSGIADLLPELRRRDVKPLGLACDTVQAHLQWLNGITNASGGKMPHFPYPIIADFDRRLSCWWGILDWDTKDEEQIPLAARAVFLVDTSHKLRLFKLYPTTMEHDLLQILHAIEFLQQTDKKKAESVVQPGLPPPAVDTSNTKCASIFPKDIEFGYLSQI